MTPTATPAPFRVIVADPPWAFGDALSMSKVKRGAAANYDTLSTAEIAALPVAQLAADDSVLVLWRPSALAGDALRVMGAWGFRQVGEVVWRKVKESGVLHFGMGRLTRATKEIAFVGVRGSPYSLVRDHSVRDTFDAPPMPHSAKPECVQDAFERMLPGPHLELFARRHRPGWMCVGNQAPATKGRDIREVLPGMVRALEKQRLLEAPIFAAAAAARAHSPHDSTHHPREEGGGVDVLGGATSITTPAAAP